MTPEDVVVQGLHAMQAGVAAKDTDALLAVFAPDAILIGSAVGETAFGTEQLRDFFDRVWAAGTDLSWTWQPPVARREGHLVWFFADGEVQHGARQLPYRASGVLREVEPGAWCWQLFNGSEPSGS
jgi:ketosteroid isomerase-like protein